jgi:hypothetical protein
VASEVASDANKPKAYKCVRSEDLTPQLRIIATKNTKRSADKIAARRAGRLPIGSLGIVYNLASRGVGSPHPTDTQTEAVRFGDLTT